MRLKRKTKFDTLWMCLSKQLCLTKACFLPFRDGIPSDAWLRAFRRRHAAEIRVARPKMQQSLRFRAINSKTLAKRFENLRKVIDDKDRNDQRIFNLDEVGISPGRNFLKGTHWRRVLTHRGCWHTSDQKFVAFAY